MASDFAQAPRSEIEQATLQEEDAVLIAVKDTDYHNCALAVQLFLSGRYIDIPLPNLSRLIRNTQTTLKKSTGKAKYSCLFF